MSAFWTLCLIIGFAVVVAIVVFLVLLAVFVFGEAAGDARAPAKFDEHSILETCNLCGHDFPLEQLTLARNGETFLCPGCLARVSRPVESSTLHNEQV